MAVESFLVTALPFTADAASPRHLSLFVTHRLTPDGGQGKVGDFPHVSDWTARLAQAHITVTGRAGAVSRSIAVTPRLKLLDPDLWPRVFPASLPVLPWQTPDPSSSPWRTYPAHRMQAHSLLAHMVSLMSSPIAAPGVAENVLARTLLTQLYDERLLTVERLLEREPELDLAVSRRLDDLAGVGKLTSSVLDGGGNASFTMLMATDAHLARRYYQRPEEAQEYLAEPTGVQPPPVVQPPPDFHRRASLLGDLSPLLRRLGLIIDVKVNDVASLVGLTEISAAIEIPGLNNPVVLQPRLSCEVTGTSFTATSASGDYTRGMLRLGDETSFTVMDLDPDASALKLEQYIRNLPRMAASQQNGDGGNAAPSTLRATGFAFARNDRAQQLHGQLANAPKRDADLVVGKGPALHLEDVARGIRLEVWDDTSNTWHSLHRRHLTVEVAGGATVLDDAPDTGFLQGASLTRTDGVPGAPFNAHEVLAGWDGWSLSAPRPGLTVVHNAGEEDLVPPAQPAPDAADPVASISTVEPGTLPRLRYGRSYAFRAWAVDLAGNSSPHTVAGPPEAGDEGVTGAVPAPPAPAVAKTAGTVAAQRLQGLDREAGRLPGRAGPVAGAGIAELRSQLTALRPPPPQGPQPGRDTGGLDLADLEVTGVAPLDRLVAARRLTRTAPVGPALTRRARIEQAIDTALPQSATFVERTDTQVPATAFTGALSAAALAQPALSAAALNALLQLLSDVVTTPRPFLRWEPVLEPTVVPRAAYSEAESLLTLVIRSGVEGPGPDGLTMTVVPPDQYVPATLAAHPELDLPWRVDSQRHLVAPKASQFECELHGLFDAAMGPATPAEVKAALAAALRESGTLTDTTVADLTTPGARIPQPGVVLVTGPTADAPAVTDPADLVRGAGLSRGQYVVHDVDSLQIPYLPDPMADGVSFVFPDGGTGTELTGLFAVEGTRLPYEGAWPEPVPWRLVLTAGTELGADAENSVVRMTVPAGEQLRMNVSSSLKPATLDLLGMWRSLPATVRANELVAGAAADGWFWWLTPATQVRLVHAVPRPLQAPRITLLKPVRTEASTSVTLFAGVDVHGPSTDRLDVEATWTEPVDDLTKPGPEDVDVTAAVCHTTVRPDEDLAVLGDKDQDVPLPGGASVHVHAAVHHLGDTKHRMIDYRMRATTRYREYFDPHLLPTLDDASVAGPVHRADVPSSARPGKPVVRDLLPLLRWDEETEPGQPFAVSRTRRCGVRIYLDRPWYTTGEGELLAVLLRHGPDALSGDEVSQWGADPIFVQQGPGARGSLPLVDLLHLAGLDDRLEAGRPVRQPSVETLVDLPGQPSASVLGYRPEFSTERGLWFVDVAVDPGAAFWPFLRLSVARYQPSSLPGLSLSPIVKCDFVQLLPPRTTLLSRPDAQHARVVVTGPVGVPRGFQRDSFEQSVTLSRTMFARLEQRVPSVGTDLGWRTVAATALPVRGVDATMVSWEGELDLPTALPPERPGSSPDWRVTVEEWEALPADSIPSGSSTTTVLPTRFGRRVVYADRLAL